MPKVEYHDEDLVVIGAGAAGIHAALELAKQYPDRIIHLIEAAQTVGGTFGQATTPFKEGELPKDLKATPGRMGLGLHYAHEETGIFYLRETMKFRRDHPEFFIDNNLPYQKGIYVVVKKHGDIPASSNSPEELEEVYKAYREEYKKLVKANPSNAVYGDPENFLVKLPPEQYPAHINPDIIAAAYQTQEVLLHVEKYANHLYAQLKQQQNIKLHLNTTVTDIKYGSAELHVTPELEGKAGDDARVFTSNFVVLAEQSGELIKIPAAHVVNAAWQNAEQLADTLVPGNYENQQRGRWVAEPVRKAVKNIKIATGVLPKTRFFTEERTWETPAGAKLKDSISVLYDEQRQSLEPKKTTDQVGQEKKNIDNYIGKTISTSVVPWSQQRGEKRQNRLKVLVRFRLPLALSDACSVFFCMGPHCMFSNNGDLGKGYVEGHLTVADITNVATTTDLTLPEEMQRLLAGNLEENEKFEYLFKLFKGAARYIKVLPQTDEELESFIEKGLASNEMSLHFGIVQTFAPATEKVEDLEVQLKSKDSSMHRRDDLRVDAANPVLGVTRAVALKGGSYGPTVGSEVAAVVEGQGILISEVHAMAKEFVKSYKKSSAIFCHDKTDVLLEKQVDLRHILRLMESIETSSASCQFTKTTSFKPGSPSSFYRPVSTSSKQRPGMMFDDAFKQKVTDLLCKLAELYLQIITHVNEIIKTPIAEPHINILRGLITSQCLANSIANIGFFQVKQVVNEDIKTGPADKLLKECDECISRFHQMMSSSLASLQASTGALHVTSRTVSRLVGP